MDGALDGVARIALSITATSERGPLDELLVNGVGGDAGFEGATYPSPFTSRLGAVNA